MLSWKKSANEAEQQTSPADLWAEFDGLLGAAGVGCWRYRAADGAFICNAGLSEIYGKAFASVTQPASLSRALFGDAMSDAALAREWNAAWQVAHSFSCDVQIARLDGSTGWVRLVARSEFKEGGELDQVSGVMLDISEHRRREGAVEAALAERALESDRRSDFVANMSHEIRTPLNGVLGTAQILSATELNAQQRTQVDTILSSSRAMLRILDQSLDLARIDASEIEIDPAPFDLEALVGEVTSAALGIASQKGVEVSHVVDPACAERCVGDADRLRQVLTNIVFNGVKFTDEGSVSVSVQPIEDGFVRFEVRDTGVGVSAKNLERIFERFERARNPSTQHRAGTGLGLAIAKALVEAMGGRIGADSLPNQGSVFWFETPILSASTKEFQAPGADGSHDPATSGSTQRGAVRVLVAEDDPTNQYVFESALESCGYEVETANNGLEAIERLQSAHFDLVLMDINMPELSGEEAIVQIRASDQAWRNVPIIVITALTGRDSRRYYCGIGANDYLPKPIDVALLIKKAENLLRGQEAA